VIFATVSFLLLHFLPLSTLQYIFADYFFRHEVWSKLVWFCSEQGDLLEGIVAYRILLLCLWTQKMNTFSRTRSSLRCKSQRKPKMSISSNFLWLEDVKWGSGCQ
jgi:hypothetical protein